MKLALSVHYLKSQSEHFSVVWILSLLHTTLAGCSRRHHQAWLGCVVQTGAIKISSLGPFFVEISRSWILRSGQESVIQLMMCAESVPYILSPATSLVSSTAGNEPSRSFKFHNHGEGPFEGFLLVESSLYSTFTFKNLWRHYAMLNEH